MKLLLLLKRFGLWLGDHFLGTTLSLLLLGFLIQLVTFPTKAATSYDVHNNPQMYLDASILSSQTTNIKVTASPRNSVEYTIPTTTGGILRIRQGSKVEDVYFATGSVNATTKVMTLFGVIRDVCPQVTREIRGCGNAQSFSKGAVVELSIAAQLLNLKANVDRANIFTASGGVAFSGSGSFLPPRFATTAARDQQLGATGNQIVMACVEATALCYLRLGGAWSTIGNTGSPNATITTAGIGELSTVSTLSGAELTSDSGGPFILGADLVIRRSTGAINNRNKLVATNNQGVISGSLLPNLPINKFNGGTNASNITFWRGDGTWASAGPRVLYMAGTGSNTILATGETDFNKTLTMTGTTVATGGTLKIYAAGHTINAGSNTPKLRVYVGTQLVATLTGTHLGLATSYFEINSSIQLRKHQPGGEIQANSSMLFFPHTNATAPTFNPVKTTMLNKAAFNTINNPVIKISGEMAAGSNGNTIKLDQFRIEYLPPTN
jgi:hypothetical protein